VTIKTKSNCAFAALLMSDRRNQRLEAASAVRQPQRHITHSQSKVLSYEVLTLRSQTSRRYQIATLGYLKPSCLLKEQKGGLSTLTQRRFKTD